MYSGLCPLDYFELIVLYLFCYVTVFCVMCPTKWLYLIYSLFLVLGTYTCTYISALVRYEYLLCYVLRSQSLMLLSRVYLENSCVHHDRASFIG